LEGLPHSEVGTCKVVSLSGKTLPVRFFGDKFARMLDREHWRHTDTDISSYRYDKLLLRRLPVTLYLITEDVDKVVAKALKLGATSVMPVMDMFRDDRCGAITDPEGINWMIATHKEEPTPAEINKRMKEPDEGDGRSSDEGVSFREFNMWSALTKALGVTESSGLAPMLVLCRQPAKCRARRMRIVGPGDHQTRHHRRRLRETVQSPRLTCSKAGLKYGRSHSPGSLRPGRIRA
jgi:hypothetical protein